MKFRPKDLFSRYKAIFFIVGLSLVGISGITIIFDSYTDMNIKFLAELSIKTAEDMSEKARIHFVNTMSATLEALLANNQLITIFRERNRERLYQFTAPLFRHFKQQNSITHWYFLNPEPDNTCFLRVHKPDLYGDTITRYTFDRCRATKQIATGIELGKTAFALRVVKPVYLNRELIGYMELGVDMEDFFSYLKDQTKSDFSVLANKAYLVREKWISVMGVKQRKNEWESLPRHLLILTTTFQDTGLPYPGEIEKIPDQGLVLEQTLVEDHMYIRGVFPLYDAFSHKMAAVYVYRDVSFMYQAMKKQNQTILLLVFVFMGVLTFFMIFFHQRAGTELRRYRRQLEVTIAERTDQLEQEFNARMMAEKKKVQAVKLAEQSSRMASIGVMAAGITHEINQPLNVIKVTADSIQYWHKKNRKALPSSFIKQLKNISQSVNRIVQIIQHMRNFWVVPDNPKVSEINLNQAVKNAIVLLQQQLKFHRIEDTIAAARDPILIKCNLIHLEQIIINIITNAIQALKEVNRPKKKIWVFTSVMDGSAMLTIVDNGPGIPEMEVEKLLDPFYTTKQNGQSMGLGLAIVKNYLNKYNGEIDLQINEMGGTTVKVGFPWVGSDKEEK